MLEGFHVVFETPFTQAANTPSGVLVRDPAMVVSVRNNVIEGFIAGIEVNSSATVNIENNEFVRNYYGISSVNSSGSVYAVRNSIQENTNGVFCSECRLDLQLNTIFGNGNGLKVAMRDSSFPFYVVSLSENTISKNKKGVSFHQAIPGANAMLDIGGGGYSMGKNLFDSNDVDILNESDGTIYAKTNSWTEQNVIDNPTVRRIILD